MTGHGIPRVSEVEPISDSDRQKGLQRIAEYKGLVDLIQSKIQEQELNLEVLQLTSKLLSQNPEYYTIWNHRRQVLQNQLALTSKLESPSADTFVQPTYHANHEDLLNLITTDLAFVFSLLRKFPKCYWIWNHRLWLLHQAYIHLSITTTRELWKGELILVGKMLTLDSRNFHGWGYRRTVVAALESKALSLDGAGMSMAKEEFDYTTRMISTNMSNFSAWHNRSKLIPRLLDEMGANNEDRRKMLDDELTWIQEGLYTDSKDQSLWFYHQNLMCNFDPTFAKQSMAPNLSQDERLSYIKAEMDKLIEMLEDDEDSKWMYSSLISLALLYRKTASQWPAQAEGMPVWMASLKKLDQLRSGRWIDLERCIQIDT